MKKCVILAAMPITAVLKPYCANASFLIAADGGYCAAELLGLTPDLLLGDYDSAPPPECTTNVLRLPAEKDDTDTYFAARKALEYGAQEVVLLGGLGGRLDHTLANLHTLLFLQENGVRVLMADETTEVRVLGPGTHCLQRPAFSCYLSFFPVDSNASGVTLQGVKYPLKNAVLTNSFPIGVSNEFASEQAAVTVGEGRLFCLIVRK